MIDVQRVRSGMERLDALIGGEEGGINGGRPVPGRQRARPSRRSPAITVGVQPGRRDRNAAWNRADQKAGPSPATW